MKVLKKGRPQKGWATEHSCTGAGNGLGGCGAILLVEQSDLFQTSRCCQTDPVEYFITFQCPECGVLTDLSSSCNPPVRARELPHWKEWLKAKEKNGPVDARPPGSTEVEGKPPGGSFNFNGEERRM